MVKGKSDAMVSPKINEISSSITPILTSNCEQYEHFQSDDSEPKIDTNIQENEPPEAEVIVPPDLPLAVHIHTTTARLYTSRSPTKLIRFSPLKSSLLKATTETPLLHPTVLEPCYTAPTSLAIQQRWVIPPLALDKIPIRRKKIRKPNAVQIQAATKIQSWLRGCFCRAKYRAKREKFDRRRTIRNQVRSLSPFINERPVRFPIIQIRAPNQVETDVNIVHTDFTAREVELLDELKQLNQALENQAMKKRTQIATRLPILKLANK
ncbi:hypothetical protein THRCLA_02689 [Thraustotheca clavata]|uniref:Uncharacterized protein n=1 Tax=Thraustotheca clavata TaxID=74557 RepID=A0A1W0A4B8_9STRA|nr:hypothetical protein THRCLA_02689 [Thraustotheca clavata]